MLYQINVSTDILASPNQFSKKQEKTNFDRDNSPSTHNSLIYRITLISMPRPQLSNPRYSGENRVPWCNKPAAFRSNYCRVADVTLRNHVTHVHPKLPTWHRYPIDPKYEALLTSSRERRAFTGPNETLTNTGWRPSLANKTKNRGKRSGVLTNTRKGIKGEKGLREPMLFSLEISLPEICRPDSEIQLEKINRIAREKCRGGSATERAPRTEVDRGEKREETRRGGKWAVAKKKEMGQLLFCISIPWRGIDLLAAESLVFSPFRSGNTRG